MNPRTTRVQRAIPLPLAEPSPSMDEMQRYWREQILEVVKRMVVKSMASWCPMRLPDLRKVGPKQLKEPF